MKLSILAIILTHGLAIIMATPVSNPSKDIALAKREDEIYLPEVFDEGDWEEDE
jgi:hypothetical protein